MQNITIVEWTLIWHMRTESNHCVAEGTKPEPKQAKCDPLPGKDLNEKTEDSNGTGHSLEVPAQVAKIDLLLEVGNIWDPEKRTMGTCYELQIEPRPPPTPPKFWILHIYRWQKLLIQLWGTTKKDLSATPTDPHPHNTHTHTPTSRAHTHTYIAHAHTHTHTHTHTHITQTRTHTQTHTHHTHWRTHTRMRVRRTHRDSWTTLRWEREWESEREKGEREEGEWERESVCVRERERETDRQTDRQIYRVSYISVQ